MAARNRGKVTFCQKMTDDLVEIALSRTISKINGFFAEIQDGRQKYGKMFFGQKLPVDSVDIVEVNFFVEIAQCFPGKCVFAFYAEIQK